MPAGGAGDAGRGRLARAARILVRPLPVSSLDFHGRESP